MAQVSVNDLKHKDQRFKVKKIIGSLKTEILGLKKLFETFEASQASEN